MGNTHQTNSIYKQTDDESPSTNDENTPIMANDNDKTQYQTVEYCTFMSTYKNAIHSNPTKYGYLRCLSDADADAFMHQLIELILRSHSPESDRVILSGIMATNIWCKIMSMLQIKGLLTLSYKLWETFNGHYRIVQTFTGKTQTYLRMVFMVYLGS